MPRLINLSGQRFGTFTVGERMPGPSGTAWWLATCVCGASRPIRGDRLTCGKACCFKCSWRHERPRRYRRMHKSFSEIISANSEFVTESGCRIWTGGVSRDGYGKLYWNYKTIKAHRAAWIDERGPIPDGLWILHRCDVRPCINVEHLFLGTCQDNVDDYWAKRRRFERAVAEQSNC